MSATQSISEMHLELTARMAAQKLMHDYPSVGADLTEEELERIFYEVLREYGAHLQRQYGPG